MEKEIRSTPFSYQPCYEQLYGALIGYPHRYSGWNERSSLKTSLLHDTLLNAKLSDPKASLHTTKPMKPIIMFH